MSVMDRLFATANLKCTACGSPAGSCGCWTKCKCGWSTLKGEDCRNPVHERERVSREAAEFVASSVILHMRSVYPEPMRHASGGFAKTLKAAIAKEAAAMVLEILNTPPGEIPDDI